MLPGAVAQVAVEVPSAAVHSLLVLQPSHWQRPEVHEKWLAS